MSEAFVGGEDASGDDLVGDVFLFLVWDGAGSRGACRGASKGRFLSGCAGSGCFVLIRWDRGVPELELESSSSIRRFGAGFEAGFEAGFGTGSLAAGFGLAAAFSIGRSANFLTGFSTGFAATFAAGLVFASGTASSPEESEFSIISWDRGPRPPFALDAFELPLVGDDFFDVAALALEGLRSLLACASEPVIFFVFGRGFELDLVIASPPSFCLSLGATSPSSLEVEVEFSSTF